MSKLPTRISKLTAQQIHDIGLAEVARIKAEMMKVMLGNGAMTIDEARARRSLNPLPNDAGKGRLIPTTYMLVDDSNKVIVAAAGVDPELAKQQADQAAKTAADAAAAADATSTADQQTDAAKGAVPTVPPLRH